MKIVKAEFFIKLVSAIFKGDFSLESNSLVNEETNIDAEGTRDADHNNSSTIDLILQL